MEIEKCPKGFARTPRITSCGWKRPNDGSFMSNLKEQFQDFVKTPIANHKVCFKNAIDEMVANFRKEVHGFKGGESSATIQSLPAKEDN